MGGESCTVLRVRLMRKLAMSHMSVLTIILAPEDNMIKIYFKISIKT